MCHVQYMRLNIYVCVGVCERVFVKVHETRENVCRA